MGIKFEKTIAVIICILGVSSVAYGMSEDNNVVFVVGLLFIVGGYLMIRRKLKGDGKRQIR
jgi:LPXTG-motif cell wall-anchored protein